MHQIKFINKELGTRIFLPLYLENDFILEVHARTIAPRRKKRRVEISIDKSSPLELELLSCGSSDSSSNLIAGLNKGYVFYPDPSSNFNVSIQFKLSEEYNDEDLNEDNHIGKIVRTKSHSLVIEDDSHHENARRIYEYVLGIPFTGERFVGKYSGKPRTPTQVVRSNRAKKCVCKAELFKDLCVASGIPARTLGAEYYNYEDVLKYETQRKTPNKNHSHAFASFYHEGWGLVDPTLGGFDGDFRVSNYYSRVVSAKGIESLEVVLRIV